MGKPVSLSAGQVAAGLTKESLNTLSAEDSWSFSNGLISAAPSEDSTWVRGRFTVQVVRGTDDDDRSTTSDTASVHPEKAPEKANTILDSFLAFGKGLLYDFEALRYLVRSEGGHRSSGQGAGHTQCDDSSLMNDQRPEKQAVNLCEALERPIETLLRRYKKLEEKNQQLKKEVSVKRFQLQELTEQLASRNTQRAETTATVLSAAAAVVAVSGGGPKDSGATSLPAQSSGGGQVATALPVGVTVGAGGPKDLGATSYPAANAPSTIRQ